MPKFEENNNEPKEKEKEKEKNRIFILTIQSLKSENALIYVLRFALHPKQDQALSLKS